MDFFEMMKRVEEAFRRGKKRRKKLLGWLNGHRDSYPSSPGGNEAFLVPARDVYEGRRWSKTNKKRGKRKW